MSATLTRRITKLESRTLPPGLREIATAAALEEGLDPEEVMKQCKVILRQIQEAGIPMTEAAISAFLGTTETGGTAR